MAFHKLQIAEFLVTAGEVHIGNVFRCVNAIHKIRGILNRQNPLSGYSQFHKSQASWGKGQT